AGRAQTRADSGKSKKTEENLPNQLRGVRVIRDGQVVADSTEAKAPPRVIIKDAIEPALSETPQSLTRDIRVGDRVRLRTLGSTGIVDRIRGNQAELRVGSLHMRERLANLELIDDPSYRTASGSERGSSPTVRE